MSLASGTSATDRSGARQSRGGAPLRGRLGMLLAVAMSLLMVGTAVAQSFTPVPATSSTTAPTLEGTEWVLTPSATESLAGTATLKLQDGTATGNDGCTDYFAPYTLSGSALSFGPIGVTYPPVTCAETPAAFEAAYFGLLASVSSYVLIDSTLTLIDGTSSPALTFTAAPTSPVIGTWVVTGYRGADGVFDEPVQGSVLTLSLEPDGLANGFTGCDRFDGTYVLDSDAIQFGPLTSSAVPCGSTSLQDQQDAYRVALTAVRTWTYTEYGLKLRDEAGTTQVSLVVAPAPVFARAWVPTGIADLDGNLLPPVDGSDPVLDFHGDGQLTGNTGCNSVFGDYQVAGPLIDIQLVAMTRTICVSDALNVQEAAYVAALDGATSWTQDDQGLVLLGSTGSTLMTLVSQSDVIPLPTATPSPSPSPTPKPTPKPTPATVAVPDVVGDTEADALVAFGAAGLTAGEKTRKYDAKVPSGDVLSTDPKAGVIVQRGTAIDYKVSRGPLAGCNTYTGSYSVSGSSIKLGALSTTSKACGDLATSVEDIFLASMAQVTKWKLSSDGRTLTLSGASGAPVLTFVSPLK